MFQVGDKARIVNNPAYIPRRYHNMIGTVYFVHPADEKYIGISFDTIKLSVFSKDLEKVEQNMKITLKNGAVLEGTYEQVQSLLGVLKEKLPDNEWYYSESLDRYIEIATMNKQHVRNAILKMYREWIDTLQLLDDTVLATTLTVGYHNPTYRALLKRLAQ